MEFEQDIKWSDLVQPICLPDRHEGDETATDPLDKKTVTIAGWGLTDERKNGRLIFFVYLNIFI